MIEGDILKPLWSGISLKTFYRSRISIERKVGERLGGGGVSLYWIVSNSLTRGGSWRNFIRIKNPKDNLLLFLSWILGEMTSSSASQKAIHLPFPSDPPTKKKRKETHIRERNQLKSHRRRSIGRSYMGRIQQLKRRRDGQRRVRLV